MSSFSRWGNGIKYLTLDPWFHDFTTSDQIRSVAESCPILCARQASLSVTNSRSSPRLTSIESVMPSSRLILCRPLLLLPPIPPSIRVFSSESTLRMRWPSSIDAQCFQREHKGNFNTIWRKLHTCKHLGHCEDTQCS